MFLLAIKTKTFRKHPQSQRQWKTRPCKLCIVQISYLSNVWLVAQPTRWSPIVIWVFVGQSSSWPWEPHIRGFKLLKPVLRTQMAVFDPVFCKMYLLYRSCPRRKSFSSNFCLFPSQNDCFLQPLEGIWQLSWFGVHSGRTPNWDSWFWVLSHSL